jgi:hypothetical protein
MRQTSNCQKVGLAGDSYRTAHAVGMLALRTIADLRRSATSVAATKACGAPLTTVPAPRFFYTGKGISMTGGHGDLRLMTSPIHTAIARADPSTLSSDSHLRARADTTYLHIIGSMLDLLLG